MEEWENELCAKCDKGEKITEEDEKRVHERVEELKRSNDLIRAENEMFESFISSVDPQDWQPGVNENQNSVNSNNTARGRNKQGIQSNTLTSEQKCSILEREIEKEKQMMEEEKHTSDNMLRNYKAILEAADISMLENRKDKRDFERDVVKPLKEKIWGMQGLDKVLSYFENNFKKKESQITRLHLQNKDLKAQQAVRLCQRKDPGETLNELEIQNLQIENTNYHQLLQDLTEELKQCKKKANSAQRALYSYKEKLQSEIGESVQLDSDIAKCSETLKKNEKEMQQVEEERSKEEMVNRRLYSKLPDGIVHVPDVFDYIEIKKKHKALQRNFKDLERKVEIAERPGISHTKASNKQRARADFWMNQAVFKLPDIVNHSKQTHKMDKDDKLSCVQMKK